MKAIILILLSLSLQAQPEILHYSTSEEFSFPIYDTVRTDTADLVYKCTEFTVLHSNDTYIAIEPTWLLDRVIIKEEQRTTEELRTTIPLELFSYDATDALTSNLINLWHQYQIECYNDSIMVGPSWLQEVTDYGYPLCINHPMYKGPFEYIHVAPSFHGFMEWIETKSKKQ